MNNETYNISLSAEDMATLITCLWAGDIVLSKGVEDMGKVTPEWVERVRTLALKAMIAKMDEA